MIKIGIIGKTNAGKTTFFNAATSLYAEVSTYPFTTKKPNIGKAYVQTICACKELKVKDNPVNSLCVDGWRFIPIELIDLPGLIKDAWRGKGLGIQFLSVAAQADALLHIVDASGSIDKEGRLGRPGIGNPVLDVYDIEEEMTMWFMSNLERNMEKILKRIEKAKIPLEKAFFEVLAGLKVKIEHVKEALNTLNLNDKEIKEWSKEDIRNFSRKIRELSKPTIIVANKMDLAYADANFERLRDEFKDTFVVPCSSEAELALKRAEQKGFIKYVPGEEAFEVIDESKLTKEQKWALNYVQQRVFSKIMRTGVQFAINLCIFKLLKMNTVYPVEDPNNLSDKKGNVLPDVFLVPPNATVKDLAAQIHTDLAKTMIYAIDARTGLRLPTDYVIRDRDIISIVASTRKKA
ncbi:MAG: redox-regulated ATPase YchF [Candidatus Bathyarchaeia archaeon]